jgi:hypothetical protein
MPERLFMRLHLISARAGGNSPVPEGAGGGYVSRERDSADDARLLQQIRSALNGAGGNLSAAAEESECQSCV